MLRRSDSSCELEVMERVLKQKLEAALGRPVREITGRGIGGGCINEALCLQGKDERYFVKLNRPERLAMFEAEAAGLQAIVDAGALRGAGMTRAVMLVDILTGFGLLPPLAWLFGIVLGGGLIAWARRRLRD